ncbi:MAG: helix-turn-helix transcriptional regulator [Bacilli bacterium]|nr:helix-turn-helix transcriptional regulator [Bacilli bacterium]
MNSKNLVMLRNKKDLTQREMAKIIKVSKSTYARWETQEEIIPLWHLLTFCNYFKVSMDYVLGLSEKNDYHKYDYTKKLNKEKIGNFIKVLRKKNKLTQKELASILNTSQSTISAYESGKTLLLTAFAYNIAKEFNISIDKLCDRVKEKKVTKV